MASRSNSVPNQRGTKNPVDGQSANSSDFGQHVRVVLERIRAAMMRLIEGLPGPIRRAVDLQRTMEIDSPLAWRIFKIAVAEDALDVAEYVPTPGTIKILVNAAREKAIPEAVITEVQRAIAGYAQLLDEQAATRDTLNGMIAALRPGMKAVIGEKCRKILFQQNSLAWGVRCDLHVSCCIDHPASRPDASFVALICGRVGFHEVRPGTLHELKMSTRMRAPAPMNASESAAAIDIELLKGFCTPDLDAKWREDEQGGAWIDVKLAGLGRRAAVNHFHLVTSEVVNNDPFNNLSARITLPTAMVHLDILQPASVEPRTGRARVYGRLMEVAEAWVDRPVDMMPVDISATHMGTITDVPSAKGVPHYTDMVRRVLEKQGWYGTRFDLYRCRFAFPILHTLVNLRVDRGVAVRL